MGISLRASRVALWSLAIAGAIAAIAAGLSWQAPLVAPAVCNPLPPNIKFQGLALGPQAARDALATYGKGSAELRSRIQPGDRVYEFESPTTGGHGVVRGDCYIGHVVSWVR